MKTIEEWLKIVMINLCLVALLGVTLRYKIAFSLPFIDQKNLLHGHSHFAFSGWITQALMTLLLFYLWKQGQQNVLKRYRLILLSNLLTAYGMLISFPIQGYGFFSILFSTLSIFTSYIFAVMYWMDLNKLKTNSNPHLWFKAALLFNVFSSIGPFSLAFMMGTHMISQKLYLVSVYYFLHFQYNGWFLFTCLGLLIFKFNELISEEKKFKYIFWMFALSCPPCYFLSALWLPIPTPIYILIVCAAIIQLTAWIWLIKIIGSNISSLKNKISKPAKWLMFLSALSMSIKLILQLGSTHPALSHLAFGFRPIVIGYIHLVLLGVISIFILGYIISEKLIYINRSAMTGIIIFISGIFINEILLMTQGSLALFTINLPYSSIYLFIAAIIMFTGIFLINITQYNSLSSTMKNETLK
jgi:hypothetical protein